MRIYNFENPVSEEKNDEFFMKQALAEAQKALEKNEVPIGAIVVYNNKIIGRGHNLTETLKDVTAHAEMQAFTAAANYIGGKYLKDCVLYVTIEPCVMCAGAAYWTQIGKIVFGAFDEKRGYHQFGKSLVHPKTEIISEVLKEECAKLVQDFFKSKRKTNTL